MEVMATSKNSTRNLAASPGDLYNYNLCLCKEHSIIETIQRIELNDCEL